MTELQMGWRLVEWAEGEYENDPHREGPVTCGRQSGAAVQGRIDVQELWVRAVFLCLVEVSVAWSDPVGRKE